EPGVRAWIVVSAALQASCRPLPSVAALAATLGSGLQLACSAADTTIEARTPGPGRMMRR
ncbi:hypothetical protein, partial [Pseudomonas aeruginosa]